MKRLAFILLLAGCTQTTQPVPVTPTPAVVVVSPKAPKAPKAVKVTKTVKKSKSVTVTKTTTMVEGFGPAVIENAKSLSYIREKTNHNDHPMIDKMLAYLGLPKGLSWCLAFCVWNYHVVADSLGIPIPVMKTARVYTLWHAAQGSWKYRVVTASQYRWGAKVPKGAIAIFARNPTTTKANWDGHAELYDGEVRPAFHDWGGNTTGKDKGDQREGGGVFYRKRGPGTESFRLMGFVIPVEAHL